MEWVKRLVREVRGNALWDITKYLVFFALSLLALVGYRILVWLRQLQSDRVVDLVVFISAFVLLFVAYGLTKTPRVPIAANVQKDASVESNSSPIPATELASPPTTAPHVPASAIVSVTDRTEVDVRLDLSYPFYRLAVSNNGTNVARGVEVWIERIWGSLHYTIEDHLPHRIRTRDTKERRSEINPGREELFLFIGVTMAGGDREVRYDIDGIQVKPSRNRRADVDYMTLRPGEYFHVKIRVSCANAEDKVAVFFAQQVEYTIDIHQVC